MGAKESGKQPPLLPVTRIDTLSSGEVVQPGQTRPVSQHNKTGANGKPNSEKCIGPDDQPSTFGTVALFQIGLTIRPATQCNNCFYREF